MLVHGHLDSWGEGIGDNATGDATLLELARALHENRQNLARSVRIAWWSGHSHGRYAGQHLVRGHLRPRSDRALRRAGELRLPRLPLGDRVSQPLLYAGPRRVHAGGDPRCDGPPGGGRAAAARGRLLLQQPRHLRHLDALLDHAAVAWRTSTATTPSAAAAAISPGTPWTTRWKSPTARTWSEILKSMAGSSGGWRMPRSSRSISRRRARTSRRA